MTILIKSMITLGIISFFALSLLAQRKSIKITSTEFIEASQQEIFDLLITLEKFPEWSPFVVSDPNQKNYVTGEDGTIGATFHWEGVDEKSLGYQVLAATEGNYYVRMECTLQKPHKGFPVFEYQLIPKDGGVEVVQNFSLKCNGFQKMMMKMFGVKKEMKNINQLGLARMKLLLEKEVELSKL